MLPQLTWCPHFEDAMLVISSLGHLWICFICQSLLLLSRSFSGSWVCIVKLSRWFCSKMECEKPFMWVWSLGHDLTSLGICHHPSLLMVQSPEKKPVDPVYFSLHTLGHWSLVGLVGHILNQPWQRWTFLLKTLIHEVWCTASLKNSVILSEESLTEKEWYCMTSLICGIWKEMIQMTLLTN